MALPHDRVRQPFLMLQEDRGVAVRVLQRILALTAVIWHNMRSLVAYD